MQVPHTAQVYYHHTGMAQAPAVCMQQQLPAHDALQPQAPASGLPGTYVFTGMLVQAWHELGIQLRWVVQQQLNSSMVSCRR